jgi:hypothetical protein
MLAEGCQALQAQYKIMKAKFPDAHTSCVWRNEVWQNSFFADGRSKKKWPDSKHNRMIGGKPASTAMDIFRLNERGEAEFRNGYYKQIADYFKDQSSPIRWGGDWNGDGLANEKWRDPPHFEIEEFDGSEG